MPKAMTDKQRRFMYAELGKKEKGQYGETEMTSYVKKHKGKK